MVVVVWCCCYSCISCCDVIDGGSNDQGRVDEVFSTKDMMAPTPKLKTPIKIEKNQQACGLWFLLVCWFVGFLDFWILDCWFIVCWIVVGCLCVLLFALLDLEVLVNIGVDCSPTFFDVCV